MWSAFSFTAYGQESQSGAPQQAPSNPPDQQAPTNPSAKEQEASHFDVWEYRVQGNTLLERQDIERAVYPYLGKDKSLPELEKARSDLERRYHDAGYATVLVDIPPQDIVDGIVNLSVTEGKVGRLRITGSRYFSLREVRGRVPALAEGTVPHLPTAQEQLLALNSQIADRSVTPVLRPGKTPGTVEVELKVKDQLPLHGSVELNNRYSIDTSRLRLNAMLRYDNLWQKGHSFSLQYQTSPEKPSEVKVWSGTYLARSDQSKNMLALYGVKSDSSTATVGTLAVVGKGDIVGARWIVPLAGAPGYNPSLTLGADYKSFKESVVLLGADSLNTPISYVPFVVQYNVTRRGDTDLSQYGASLNFGVRGLENDTEKFENKRFKARANYMYLRVNLERDREIYRGMRLRVKLDGQLTDSPLISNEQFSAGGADSVRGYHESERLGDDGVQATVELSTPALAKGQLQELRGLAFADGAALRVRSPLPGQDSRYVLSSAGIGLRLQAWQHLNASLDLARPFKEQGSVKKNDDRIHFSLEYTF